MRPSVVHMIRIISALRKLKVISWVDDILTILDWEHLQVIAECDPTYLSLVRERR